MKIRPLVLLVIMSAFCLLVGCGSVCTKPEEGYVQNSPECRRFCADAECKYWGHSNVEADLAYTESLRLQNEANQEACVTLGVAPNTEAMTSCIRSQEKEHAMIQIQNSTTGSFAPNTYYLEK